MNPHTWRISFFVSFLSFLLFTVYSQAMAQSYSTVVEAVKTMPPDSL